MRRPPALMVAATLALVTAACARGGGEGGAAGLEPRFAPLETTIPAPSRATPTGSASTQPHDDGGASESTAAPSTATTPPAGAPAASSASVSAALSDGTGDLTPSADRPPAFADLAGATLTRNADGFELRVLLAGEAPATYVDDRTMNIAAFFDVTGDGRPDFEVWLNLASHGWGGSFFDNTREGANRLDDDGLTVEPSGREVIARFPLDRLADAAAFRWAVASEWGRYEVIGTAAAARDDAPDNDEAVAFPGAG